MYARYGRELIELNELRTNIHPFIKGLYGDVVNEANFRGFYDAEGGRSPSTSYDNPDYPFDYIICIPEAFLTSGMQLYYVVTHELVHGFWPTGFEGILKGEKATLLNEGLCEVAAYILASQLFSEEEVAQYIDLRGKKGSIYNKALSLVSSFIQDRPNIIKDVRKVQPFVNKLKHEDFIEAGYHDLDQDLLNVLLSPMS